MSIGVGHKKRTKSDRFANTQYCIYYDERECKLHGRECIHLFCLDYITKAGVRRGQEQGIREGVQIAVQNVREQKRKEQEKVNEIMAHINLKNGDKVNYKKFGDGIVVSIDNDNCIEIEFNDKRRKIQLDANSINLLEKV